MWVTWWWNKKKWEKQWLTFIFVWIYDIILYKALKSDDHWGVWELGRSGINRNKRFAVQWNILFTKPEYYIIWTHIYKYNFITGHFNDVVWHARLATLSPASLSSSSTLLWLWIFQTQSIQFPSSRTKSWEKLGLVVQSNVWTKTTNQICTEFKHRTFLKSRNIPHMRAYGTRNKRTLMSDLSFPVSLYSLHREVKATRIVWAECKCWCRI